MTFHAHTPPAFLLAVALTSSLAAQSPTPQDLVNYLNTEFGQRVWPHAQDTIKNFVIHETFNQVEAEGAELLLDETALDLSAAPGFSLNPATGGVIARFPASGQYRLTTTVEGDIDIFPDTSGLTLDFSLEVEVGTSGPPVVRSQVTASLSDILVDAFVSEEEIEEQVRSNLGGHLGFLGTLVFNQVTLAYATPDVELIYGEPGLQADGALDVFLIADGFTAADMSDFHAQAAVLTQKLTQTDTVNHVSEPYASFRSAIRVWKLNVLSSSWSDNAQRVVTTFEDSITQSKKTGFSNLARLAQIGLRAQDLGADILVFVSAIRVQGPRGGSFYDPNARASAFGDLILLPVDSNSADTATVFLHELGHTVLGGLADEYFEGTRASETYHGLEPRSPNVSIVPAGVKWLYWLAAQGVASWDAPISSFEGAYYLGHGIFRPAEHCKMRESREERPFCQVCREAITRGIRRVLDANMALVETQYTTPLVRTSREYIRSSASTASRTLDAFGGGSSTTVRLRLAASSLPEPWTAKWHRYRPGSAAAVETRSGPDQTFTVSFGDRIDLTIGSECRFAPRDPIASYRVSFNFSRSASPTVGDPPTHLAQSVAAGSTVAVTYDPSTGAARFSLALSCRAGGYPGWTLPSTVQVNVSGPVTRGFTSLPRVRGTPVSFNVGVLPAGFYTWSARTLYAQTPVSPAVSLPTGLIFHDDGTGRIRTHRCHFQVTGPAYQTAPAAPVLPFGLSAQGAISLNGSPVLRTITLTAGSMDLNGNRLRIEFEIKLQGQMFNGLGLVQTGWLSPTLESLRVQGNVTVGPYLDYRVFRVRAVDETGRASAWVNGWTISSL